MRPAKATETQRAAAGGSDEDVGVNPNGLCSPYASSLHREEQTSKHRLTGMGNHENKQKTASARDPQLPARVCGFLMAD